MLVQHIRRGSWALFAVGAVLAVCYLMFQIGRRSQTPVSAEVASLPATVDDRDRLKFENAPGGGVVARWSQTGQDPDHTVVRCWVEIKGYRCMVASVTDMSAQSLPSGGGITIMTGLRTLPQTMNEIWDYTIDNKLSGYECSLDIDLDHTGVPGGITEEITNGNGVIARKLSTDRGVYMPFWQPWTKTEVNTIIAQNNLSASRPYFNCTYIYQSISDIGLESLASRSTTFEAVFGSPPAKGGVPL